MINEDPYLIKVAKKTLEEPELTPGQTKMIEIETWKLQRIINVLDFYRWSRVKFEIDPKTYIDEKIFDFKEDMGRKAGETFELLSDHLRGLDDI